jgi:hypothetical protein
MIIAPAAALRTHLDSQGRDAFEATGRWVPDHGRQPADATSAGRRGAKPNDLLMLSGQLRDRLDAKRGEPGVLLFLGGQSLLELADLLLQTLDLAFARVGDHPGLAELVAAPLELLLQVQVCAVERGAREALLTELTGESLQFNGQVAALGATVPARDRRW